MSKCGETRNKSTKQIKPLVRKERILSFRVIINTKDRAKMCATIVELSLVTLEKNVVQFYLSMCVENVVK